MPNPARVTWLDDIEVRIKVSGIETIALKKLSLVSHALADKIGGLPGEEQRTLARVLDDVIRRIEIATATQNGK